MFSPSARCGMVTILTETRSSEVGEAKADGDDLWLATEAVESATGWAMRPEGFCQGPVCVPIPPGRAHEFAGADGVTVAAFWRHMGQPIPHLYAAGEISSIFGNLYLEAGNITEAFIGGRIAGQNVFREEPLN